MNEVTKIHLGRQAYAISAGAHRELRNYLDAIRRHIGDEDVVSEIEMRMAELLAERGVNGDQVILPADVAFLQEQLGNPRDFAGNEEQVSTEDKQADSKRLFRDTDNAMLAGVAAGLANYFGIDTLIVRLLFVVATFTGGWGILIYLVLWLLVPEVKTSSERLQMAGKPVTIENLKDVVERADIKGAAHRANRSLSGPVNAVFAFLLKVIGTALVVVGVSMLLGLASSVVYVFLRGNSLVQDGIFPVGLREHLVIYIAATVVAMMSMFVVLFGLAVFRRKWPVRAWITGTLIGLICTGFAVGGALTADVVPQVRDRYNANMHTTVRTEQPFDTVNLNNIGSEVDIEYQTSNTYAVNLHYFGQTDLGAIKTSIANKTLTIDTLAFNPHRNCRNLCIPDGYNLTITIESPGVIGQDAPSASPDAPTPTVPAPR
jgi:phage shock protein PspC (stress-responsive transcriptional regulator)